MIETLHFLRPLWLVAIPAIALVWWLVRRRETQGRTVAAFVAPHLRDALTVNREAHGKYRAVDGVAMAMLSAAIAAAGPTYSKQLSPWFEETAPLVVAIKVTDSMRSNDLLPTRLDRARFEVLDLIEARTGSRTALIAYAGSAHIVIPPTTDAKVLKVFLESLDPAVMPVPGTDAGTVLPPALQLLGEEQATGTLLFVNDGFDGADIDALADFARAPATPAMAALVVGTDAGGVALLPDGSPVLSETGGPLDTRIDVGVMNRLAREAGVSVVRAEPGDADTRRLLRIIESNLRQADDPDAEWKDQGWWLVWPAMLLSLFWFRRGWTMKW
jgi:Ca-activated chloride channel family protein